MDAAHIIELVPPRQGTQYVVLDNACGTGAAVEWLVNEFVAEGMELDITATDYSAVMMNEVTNRRLRLNWGKNVKSLIMDAQSLSFPANTFTHVFMTFGIMLIPDFMRALKCMHHVLQRNGRVAITSWKSQGNWDYLVRAARIVFHDPSYPPPCFFDEKWLSGEYIANLLRQVGFRNVKVHEREHRWKWTSKDEFVKFVGRNTAPSIQIYTAKWTAQQKEQVAGVIRTMLDDEFPGMENFYIPMVANIIAGIKK